MPSDTENGEGRALVESPRRQQRPVTPVHDLIPIFDTASFEHNGRIAAVMAKAKLVPECLQDSTSDCFMVVNQAQRWNLDPFAVAQCCSVVHGRLMYEGKLISAVIESKLRVKLDYHFTGEKGKPDYRIYVSDKPFDDAIIAKLKPGGSYRGWRVIDGSVGDWQTLDKGGKVNQSWVKQPDMQLGYRGARTWCRRYESGIMLGIYTDDEMDQLREDQAYVVSSEPLPALSSGFGDEERQGRPQAGGKLETPKGTAQASEAPGASAGEAEDRVELEGGDRLVATEFIDPKTWPVFASLEALQAHYREEEEKGAAEAEAEDQKAAQANAAAVEEDEEETTAPAGEAYVIFGEALNDGQRRQTYKDGIPFSTVTEKGALKLPRYDHHAPKLEKAEDGAGEQRQGETLKSPPSSGGSPTPETKGLAMAEALTTAMTKLLAADTYPAIKQYLRSAQQTEDWKNASDEEADRVRGTAFARYAALVGEGKEKTPIPSDPFLFGLWMDFGAKAASEIDGLFPSLMRSPDWPKLTEAQRNAFGAKMAKAKERFQ